MTWATLHLRTRSGTVPVRVCWPGARTVATVLAVRFQDLPGHGPQPAGTVVLAARPATVEDAIAITEWAADHVREFTAAPGRLVVGGTGEGAALAAAVVRHAAEQGWPPLTHERDPDCPAQVRRGDGTRLTKENTMTAYAIAHLKTPTPHPDVLEYMERIQATLDPFHGCFLVHGPQVDVREGEWPGTVVVIEFPDLAGARGWYESPAYQQILPLRTGHIDGAAVLVEGVEPGHDAAEFAATLRRAAQG
ncbi:DUF1330 domain-containing protein [Thermoactinospora rubra]|uniref:DUF1330 domain-containing protein n=1 Tax=Thermoactinospora rubra TaxID=1088767 RepID=UPI000A0FABC2|nr:DUF1330 domain-containing protein [Thermoactinospora rubra]